MGSESGEEELRVRYSEILSRDVGIPDYKQPFYWKWLCDFLEFCRVRHLADTDRNGMALFLEALRKEGRRAFQVEQARIAVEVFWMYFRPVGLSAKKQEAQKRENRDISGDWRMAMSALSREVGLRRYSPKTLKAYRHWIRDFSRFVSEAPVASLTQERAREFITHLASVRMVAEATQNQAFSAVLFFYTHVLRIGLEDMQSVPRATKRQEIPTVLTRGEVQSVLAALEYPYRLFVQLVYGCGLRLGEGLSIRVQDLDLDGSALRVHYGKGRKSRSVPLPKTLVPALAKHLESVRALFENDLKVGFAGVFLPGALDLKLPGAARSWPWQWVFPAGKLTVTEGDGRLRRFHIHESSVQKEIKAAADASRMSKRVTAHTFRHSYATHLLQMGYDIRTVQELLGHNDVETTMIYAHVLQSMAGKVVSPLDV